MSEPTFIHCADCDRGGNGNAKDKCCCGWKNTERNHLGCYIGTPIVGEPRKHPKLSRSKARYLAYLAISECFDSFRDFLLHTERNRKEERRRVEG